MGRIERIQRLKENTRSGILKAALKIIRQEGWHALSMRRIADEIEYSVPVIYEYFANKDSLVSELSSKGYAKLTQNILAAKQMTIGSPAEKIEAMWLAYWNFAFEERELYQAMFGVEMNCSLEKGSSRGEEVGSLFSDVIKEIIADSNVSDEIVCTKYFTFWSAVHGLISINFINKGSSDDINHKVLHEAIASTIASIKQ